MNELENVQVNTGQVQHTSTGDTSTGATDVNVNQQNIASINPSVASHSQGVEASGTIDYNDVNNADLILNNVINGIAPTGKGLGTDAAKQRYKDMKVLLSLTDDQIVDTIISGGTSQVSSVMNDISKYYPERYSNIVNKVNNTLSKDNINNSMMIDYKNQSDVSTNDNYKKYTIVDLGDDITGVITNYGIDYIQKVSDSKIQDIINSYGNYATDMINKYKSLMQSPEIQLAKNNIETLQGQIQQIKLDADYIGQDVMDALGPDAPAGLVSSVVSRRSMNAQRKLNALNAQLLVEQGKLQNAMNEADTMLKIYQQGYDNQLQAAKLQMQLDKADITKGSTTSNRTTNTTTDVNKTEITSEDNDYKSLISDMLSGDYGWKTTKEVLNGYGLGDVAPDTIWKETAKYISSEDLFKIKESAPSTTYKKILEEFNRLHNKDYIDAVKGGDAISISEMFDTYGIDKETGTKIMKSAGVDEETQYKVSVMQGWSKEKTATETAKEKTIRENTENKAKELYQDTISSVRKVATNPGDLFNATLTASNKALKNTSKEAESAVKAAKSGTFNGSSVTAYGFSKSTSWGTVGTQIGGACDSYSELSQVIDGIEKSKMSATSMENLVNGVLSGYISGNQETWIANIKTIKDSKNLKLYLTSIFGSGYSKDEDTVKYIKGLLKELGKSDLYSK